MNDIAIVQDNSFWGIGLFGFLFGFLTFTIAVVSHLLVPLAMATFGKIVAGVGTIHSAGGIAAFLQKTAAMFGTAKAIATAISMGVSYGFARRYLRNK